MLPSNCGRKGIQQEFTFIFSPNSRNLDNIPSVLMVYSFAGKSFLEKMVIFETVFSVLKSMF